MHIYANHVRLLLSQQRQGFWQEKEGARRGEASTNVELRRKESPVSSRSVCQKEEEEKKEKRPFSH